jgi:hypothetical protein
VKGNEGGLQDVAQEAGFDAALVALAAFPQVIQMMVRQPDRTKAPGQAFTADKDAYSIRSSDFARRRRQPAI